jgi:putative lipoic acid-binding regulatory protein
VLGWACLITAINKVNTQLKINKETQKIKIMTEEKKSLIEYPSEFPIKVMGKANLEYLPAILHIAHQFDPTFDESKVEQRPSKDGNYLGITLPITATSREQLDELYRTLSTHPLVSVVL